MTNPSIHPPVSEKPTVSATATLFAVSTASFLMPFMFSGVGIALPSIGREMGATATQIGLVETGYMVSVSMFLLLMGRLGDVYGRKRIFQWGITLFTLMGAAISQAWSIHSVVVLRFLQGIGGAMIAATGMAIVVSVFPRNQRGKALGINVACVYAGLSCGPFLGGMIVTAWGWRWLFALCLPLGAAVFGILRWKLKGEWADARGESIDWRGAGIFSLAMIALVVGAANLNAVDWGGYLMACGALLLIGFVWIEDRTPSPLLDVHLMKTNRVFTLSSLAALLNYAATFGVTFFMSLFLQYVKGFTPQQAGTLLVLQPVTQALFSPLCGRLSDRYPAAWIATIGMGSCAVGLAFSVGIGEATSIHAIAGVLLLLGVGFALFSSPNMSVIMGSVPPKFVGVASGLVAIMRTFGMMVSMTIVTILFSTLLKGHPISVETQGDFIRCMQTGFSIYSLLCVVGVAISFGRLGREGKQDGGGQGVRG
uniref:MFS transporter n=1 Tax=Desulfatirhabdium butyrativorans TaxID=340467 RepID=A0A7C4RQZ3_9BACT